MENKTDYREKFREEYRQKANEEYLKIKGILNNDKNGKHNEAYVSRQLHEKENLRKVFLAVVKHSPAKIGELADSSLLTKPTCYSQLFKLMNLQLVERVYILPIMSGITQNDEIKEKFEEWTKHMPSSLKNYYLAKTSYWIISEFGKKFCGKAWNFENEFREESETEDKK